MNEPERLRHLGMRLDGDDSHLCYVAAYEIERHRAKIARQLAEITSLRTNGYDIDEEHTRLLGETGELRDEVKRLRTAVAHLLAYHDNEGCWAPPDDPCPDHMPGDPIQTTWPRPQRQWDDARISHKLGRWCIEGGPHELKCLSRDDAVFMLALKQSNERMDIERWDRWFGGADDK